MTADRAAVPQRSSARARRVLVAHPGSELYGSDRVTLDTVAALIERGWEVVVAVPAPGPLVERLEAHGARVETGRFPVLRKSALRPRGFVSLVVDLLRAARPTWRLLSATRPDVVYVATVTIPLWVVIARVRLIPVVVHLHEAERAGRVVGRLLLGPLVLADAILANSRFSRDVAASSVALLRRRMTVVHNPVPGPVVVTPARERIAAPLELLFVGRLSPRKGPDVAIRAVLELRRRGVDARLRLLGSAFSGYEWFDTELRRMVADAQLSDEVEFLGFREDIWEVVAASDIVVVPSVADEPFGNTAVEAVLAARPVVTSTAGGLPEAVSAFGCARSVPPGDPVALADAVVALVQHWTEVRTDAVTDAGTAQRRHSVTGYGDRVDEVIAAVVRHPRRRRRRT